MMLWARRRRRQSPLPALVSPVADSTGPRPSTGSAPLEPAEVEGRPDGGAGIEGTLKLVTSFVAPTTVITALLFYYGYVATAAQFAYFGVSVSTLGMSTQDIVLRSVATLYVPLGGLLVLALAALWTHSHVNRLLVDRRRQRACRIGGLIAVGLGSLALLRGILGILLPSLSRTEPVALSPLSLGVGIVAVSYGRHVVRAVASARGRSNRRTWADGAGVALVWALVTLSLFWATNSFASAYGRGAARLTAANLDDRPGVVLDTTERLFIGYPGIQESVLPTSTRQRFHYRYRGLRLLVESDKRLFLVPDQWVVDTGATLVVPDDGSVRLQLYR